MGSTVSSRDRLEPQRLHLRDVKSLQTVPDVQSLSAAFADAGDCCWSRECNDQAPERVTT